VKLAILLILLYVPDAHAWGLQTHLFFAQYALALVPLADPELRAAAARLPRLVLAGACLPDLAMVGKFWLRSPIFARSHRWDTLRRMAAAPANDEQRALLVGYATHLLSDVIAHNQFVPEHEARIGRGAMIAHLLAEWAMDRHLRDRIRTPDVLEDAGRHAVEFTARAFRCSEPLARRALGVLERGERLLRASPVPLLCRATVRLLDRDRARRFELYVRRTTLRLGGLNAALAGGYQDWCGSDPEGSESDRGTDRRSGEDIARIVQPEHHARGAGEQAEGHQDRGKHRVVRAGDQRERHRVKRVA
jgi:hypothetical protein